MTTSSFAVLGEAYDRPTIRRHLGGHLGFIPSRKGKPVACCFKLKDDPCAPDVLLLNEYYDEGKMLDGHRELFIPFFRYVHSRKHPFFRRWEYIGDYRVKDSTDRRNEINEELKRLGHATRTCRLALWLESRTAVEEREAANRKTGRAYQPDVLKRVAVENAAVEMVTKYFGDWHVKDVSDDNKGWDLEATRGRERLYLEVKGLSCKRITVELTPNEYKKMRVHSELYRVCVVTEALLSTAKIDVYRFRPGTSDLVAEDGARLKVEVVESARLLQI
jgi:hypothetical protein